MAAKRSGSGSDAGEPSAEFVPVAEAFAADPRVTAGRMMASFGLKVNGKIFAMDVRGRFVAKLPRVRVDELIASGAGQRFEPGPGRVMKEWVVVEPGAGDWVELAKEAYRFVGGAGRGG